MPPSYLFVLGFVSLFNYGSSLGLPRITSNALGPNPLPPLPPTPPVGPDNYPVLGTDVKLIVQRPFGEVLPYNPTILSIMATQAELDQRRIARGNVQMPKEATFEERGIKIVILSPFVNGMTIKTAHTALRGLVELMAQYAEFGTRAGSISVIKFGSPLGAIELSGSETPAVGPSALTINSTVSMDRPTDVRALDPTKYRVPDTNVTVSLEGRPPYGSPLPTDPLILTLASASAAANQAIRRFGDVELAGLWRFELGSIGIDVHTKLSVDCKFSILEAGLIGLVDLITEPGGVGAVAADFVFNEDGKGEVATGRLKYLGPSANVAENMANATLIEQSKDKSVTLVGGAMQTGVVETA